MHHWQPTNPSIDTSPPMKNDNPRETHKFGGTSLGDPECYQRVADILSRQPGAVTVVVSAMAGVTDRLFSICEQAAARDAGYLDGLQDLKKQQYALIESFGAGEATDKVVAAMESDLRDVTELLRGSWLIRQATTEMEEFVGGYGERWSARALTLLLNCRDQSAQAIDASEFLTVKSSPQGKVVLWEQTRSAYQELTGQAARYRVVTGFVARDREGRMTTLGRNGSDYSAAIMATLTDAQQLTIWTDVDGVLSADPKRVPDARVLGSMSYDEAFELAYFGAKVIHPQTMGSVIEAQIPVVIKNTFRPDKPGTRIAFDAKGDFTVKGLSTIDGLSMINIEGTGMIGVPGTAEKVFRTLHDANISVVMISQASSEHSICLAVKELQARRARSALENQFAGELGVGQISSVRCENGLSILALVGDAMAGQPGVAARFLSALGKAGINVRAIAQGSSERNISVAIRAAETTRALRAAHSAFYLSPQTYSVGIIGVGTVGSVLVDQIQKQASEIKQRFGVDIRIRALADSRRMLLADRMEGDTHWRESLAQESQPLNMAHLRSHVFAEHLPHHVIIDCTSSQTVADLYLDWMERGIHIITPNKKANSSHQSYYDSLQQAMHSQGAQYLYETNVGAGLPIIQTLQELRSTGDKIHSIKGIFSGTMAYLFNLYDGRRRFSELVEEARANGFTEPDPRDDLSGMDVARKLLILAREMGLQMELEDIEVESLVPANLIACDKREFARSFSDHDAAMKARYEKALKAGRFLRYVGEIGAVGDASVRLVAVAKDDPLASIQLTDNIVQFKTERYCDNPLVVQGPGAGPEVTAGGVFADLLRVCKGLGARM